MSYSLDISLYSHVLKQAFQEFNKLHARVYKVSNAVERIGLYLAQKYNLKEQKQYIYFYNLNFLYKYYLIYGICYKLYYYIIIVNLWYIID